MHILIPFLISLGLFLLFPKGFKFLVGTWLGVCAGGLCWSVAAIGWPAMFMTVGAFVCFVIGGIFAGCVLAAKG